MNEPDVWCILALPRVNVLDFIVEAMSGANEFEYEYELERDGSLRQYRLGADCAIVTGKFFNDLKGFVVMPASTTPSTGSPIQWRSRSRTLCLLTLDGRRLGPFPPRRALFFELFDPRLHDSREFVDDLGAKQDFINVPHVQHIDNTA